jgi:putative heme-binding domain-containing protein
VLAYHADAKQALITLALSEPLQSVRIQAISAVSRYGDEEPWKKLLAEFAGQSPTLRRAVVNAALGSGKRTTLLLDAIEAGSIKPAELDRTQVNRLLKHPAAGLKTRATKLLAAAVPEDRQKVLADYQVVLKMKADSKRGKTIFAKHCATCHKVGDVGVNVAPDISDSRTKQPAQILTDVLQPNRAIDNNYVSYSVVTNDGKLLTGIIASDTASSITLKQPEGKTVALLRTEIEELRSNGISLMPEGLEKNIPPQDMADLVAFIKNWRYLDGRTPLGPSGD